MLEQPIIPTEQQRIFISYKRNVHPDETVALEVFGELKKAHDVFIDQLMLVGTPWAERIDEEIKRSDFLITFLTAESVQSEMVLTEISKAHHWHKTQGYPKILPVRLAYRDAFNYRLSAYLDAINWAFWKDEKDTPRLIAELRQAISGNELSVGPELKVKLLGAEPAQVSLPPPLPAAQPIPLEQPSGTMKAQSKFYIKREADRIAKDAIQQQGTTITVKGPRQVGKSSLLERTVAARPEGKSLIFLDFQLFDSSVLKNDELFYPQFCHWIWRKSKLKTQIDDYSNTKLGKVQRCTYYMEDLLNEMNGPLILAMDEVERLYASDFRSDFFGMLRNWHNSRTSPPWESLDLVLITSTEPYLFIDSRDQSPFNVGEVIELEDFSRQDVTLLNKLHGNPFSPDEEEKLVGLIGAHPYLLRKAMFLVARGRITTAELFAKAAEDYGPFGDHLRTLLFHLYDKGELVKGLSEVIRHHQCADERIYSRLKGAGLVRRERGAVVARCKLYDDFFRGRING